MSEPCQVCGLPLEIGEQGCIIRVRPHVKGSVGVIGDEIPGGFTTTNLTGKPETFYSKQAMARRVKELELMPFVRHRGENGTDKSSKTSRWI